MGSMAATLLGAYQQLSTLLGALDTIRARHAALKVGARVSALLLTANGCTHAVRP
jgi:hypothetical protein